MPGATTAVVASRTAAVVQSIAAGEVTAQAWAFERAAPIMPHPSGLRLTRLPVRPPMRPQLAAVVGVAARRI